MNIVATLMVVLMPPGPVLHPAARIAAAEIAFAQQSVAEGMSTAFAAHFAEHAVDFSPLPRPDARGRYAGRPNPPFTLDWYPTFTLAAASGDFGLSTGPYRLEPDDQNLPPAFGHYVSVWQRQANGEWQVMIDAGISHPEPAVPLPRLDPATMPENQLASRAAWHGAGPEGLFAAAGDFNAFAAKGLVEALAQLGADELRVYRDGALPAVGRNDSLRLAATYDAPRWFESEGGAVAASGDLGFVYGQSERTLPDCVERGAFLQVWLRTEAGWRLLLLWDKPLPSTD